jgi:2-keto-3-deoxy-L-fuconate dehydrogenase
VTEFAGVQAVVTGAASGIGLAVVQALVEAGARVAALDRAVPTDGTLPAGVLALEADVTDNAAVVRAIADAADRLGGVDVLVNSAGIGAQGTVVESADEEWLQVLDVNVIGMARVCRAAWPHLAASGRGAIVNLASIAASAGLPQRAVYSASKGAVLALTRAMAADGVAGGIRVNAVSPGTADTPWVARLLDSAADPQGERHALEARQPHGRLVSAAEVAGAVLYLASPRAGSTTGIELAVDGGMSGLRLRPRV